MKLKLFAAVAAIVLASGGAYAAAEMKDCCKGEKCCCDKMKDEGTEHGGHKATPR